MFAFPQDFKVKLRIVNQLQAWNQKHLETKGLGLEEFDSWVEYVCMYLCKTREVSNGGWYREGKEMDRKRNPNLSTNVGSPKGG